MTNPATLHHSADHRRGGGDIALGQFEHQFVMHLQQHPHIGQPRFAQRGPMRAIARLMMSALVPWIGALMAARSLPCRSAWFFD
jgi:hypothetical protein